MSVAEKVKQLRYMVGIGQCELAKRAGVSQSFISQIENGSRVGLPETMQLIADTLGCSYEYLTEEPKFFVQFIRNCKRLSYPQLTAVNEIVLQLVDSGFSESLRNEEENKTPIITTNSKGVSCQHNIDENGVCRKCKQGLRAWSSM